MHYVQLQAHLAYLSEENAKGGPGIRSHILSSHYTVFYVGHSESKEHFTVAVRSRFFAGKCYFSM